MENTTATILVTGATGKTGRRLIPRLVARGRAVRAASRQPGDGRVAFDWHRPETWARALDGVGVIYLVPPELMEDATPVVAPFLERAHQAGVERVVLLSSLGVEFPDEPATSGRHELERLMRESGATWTLVSPGGFAQNFSES